MKKGSVKGRGRGQINRRGFLGLSALAGAGVAMNLIVPASAQSADSPADKVTAEPASDRMPPVSSMSDDPSIAELQAMMAAGKLNSAKLVEQYLQRIHMLDKNGPMLNAIIELNPDAPAIARALDEERKHHGPRGPLHGIPVLLKDNVDTADKMQTTAGSWALFGKPAPQDSTTAGRLRAAGAVILGKTNPTEFANFRSYWATSGWSGRGGQTRNPYYLDRNPLGSSAGSAVAVSANLTTVSIGTETDGSIIAPAAADGVVGIKPTLGLTSRAGVVPIAHSQDTVGPHARSVADAATLLGALVGVDPRDSATSASAGKYFTDYTQFLNPNGLSGARIGIMRQYYFGNFAVVDALAETCIAAMASAGAVIVDPADIPTITQITTGPQEFNVLLYEFKQDLNAYLATRTGIPAHTLADVIAFNETHPEEMLSVFDQIVLEMSEGDVMSHSDYLASLALERSLSQEQGIDAIMTQHNLDALVAPVLGPTWHSDWIYGDFFFRQAGSLTTPAAQAGYPIINVPAGLVYGLPIGFGFIGRAWSEPTLIKIASGFEAVIKGRKTPQFLPSFEVNQPSLPGPHPHGTKSAKAFYESLVKNRTNNNAGR